MHQMEMGNAFHVQEIHSVMKELSVKTDQKTVLSVTTQRNIVFNVKLDMNQTIIKVHVMNAQTTHSAAMAENAHQVVK